MPITERVKQQLGEVLQRGWYQGAFWCQGLRPLSALTATFASARLKRFRQQLSRPPVPVLVVGNITVGGTGKTPLVIALCRNFSRQGKRVAVISRGYGGRGGQYPFVVSENSTASESGDEPLLIARRVGVPVVVDPDRRAAMLLACQQFQPDIIISDDGLQHYALPRTVEIAVLDGSRGIGNGLCLPAGPLREPASRLEQVDWCVVNGKGELTVPNKIAMQLTAGNPVNLLTGKTLPLDEFIRQYPFVHGVAAIGHPQRFFDTLCSLGLTVTPHPLPDHHRFSADDLHFGDGRAVLMTEKDAVKCQALAQPNHWYLPVDAQLPEGFADQVLERLLRRDA